MKVDATVNKWLKNTGIEIWILSKLLAFRKSPLTFISGKKKHFFTVNFFTAISFLLISK